MVKVRKLTTNRKEVRHEVCDILKGKTGAGDRVFPNKVAPVGQEELPQILIYPAEGDTTMLDSSRVPNARKRFDLFLTIEVITDEGHEGTDLNDKLDDLSFEVEKIIEQSDNLNKLVHDIGLSGFKCEYFSDGSKPWATCKSLFNVTYIKIKGE